MYWTLACLSEAYADAERYDEAVPYAQEAVVVTREIGNRRGEGVALHDLDRAMLGAWVSLMKRSVTYSRLSPFIRRLATDPARASCRALSATRCEA